MNNRCTLLILSVGIAISSLYGCTAFTTTNTQLTSKGSCQNINKNIGSARSVHHTTNNQNSCLHRQTITTAISSRRDVSLSMGIRSFIKRKILRKGEVSTDDNDDLTDDEDSDIDENKEDVTLRSILQSESPSSNTDDDDESSIETTAEDDDTSSINSMKSKLKSKIKSAKDKVSGKDTESNTPSNTSDQYVNDILTKNNNIPYETEDTKQRIRRMKSGTGMTEEEKQSFLTNALTRTLPKSKPKGPPIRQEIPGMDTKSGDSSTKKSGGEKDKKSTDTSSSSSAATTTSPLDIIMDGKMKNEDAKRRYMESITNPDRFATFSTYQQPGDSGADSVVDEEVDTADVTSDIESAAEEDEGEIESSSAEDTASADFAQMKRQIAEDRELLNPVEKQEQSAARDAVESILSMISANNDKKAESKDDDDDDTSTSKTKSKDDHLAARLGKAAMEQEKRDAEARAAAEKKKADEKRRYAELQKQREEQAERRETERMEKARAVAEKARRREEETAAAQRRELEARQAAQDEYWAKQLKKDTARKERSEPIDITRKKEIMARDSEERMEREVAKDAERSKIREEERAREDPHESEILKEAAERKMKDRELVRDIEAQSAARISNTVPRKPKEDASVSAFVREQQKKKEEIDRLRKLDEESLKSLNSPLPSPGRPPVGISPSPYQALDNIPTPPPPAPVPVVKSSAAPDLSLASLTMSKKSESAPEPTVSSPSPAPAERLNLFEMTKLKDDAASRPAVKKSSPPKKRIVRQQVLLDDDDEEDDDSMLSGAPGLTIADALKKERKKGGGSGPGGKDMSANDKAKAWGIDMSKFT